MCKEDKKTLTIRFNITDTDKEMTAILNALNTSDRVEFIKECVMIQSRRILRNEAESLKVDSLKLKEEYKKNGVNVCGVTFYEDKNEELNVLEKIGLILQGLDISKIQGKVDESVIETVSHSDKYDEEVEENIKEDNIEANEEYDVNDEEYIQEDIYEDSLDDEGVPPNNYESFEEYDYYDDEDSLPPMDSDDDLEDC